MVSLAIARRSRKSRTADWCFRSKNDDKVLPSEDHWLKLAVSINLVKIFRKIYLTGKMWRFKFKFLNQKNFIVAAFLGLAFYVGFSSSVRAQVYSSNIVGYINLVLLPGDNLIANQLGSGDDTLNNLFSYNIPEGTTFTKWDPWRAQFMPLSTYDIHSGWSINYGLTFGEGGELNPPTTFTNTFVGNVWPGYNGDDPFVPPIVIGSGKMLLSCFVPFSNATFYDVIGRNPINGDSVTTLDARSQLSSTTTFENGFWNNGDPSLNVGQSAFFKLQAAPEPRVQYLSGIGGVLFATIFRKQML